MATAAPLPVDRLSPSPADVPPPQPSGRGLEHSPLLRSLLIYRHMPVRFTLTALLFVIVNLCLVGQQWLIGQAVHEAGNGQMIRPSPAGGLDYDRAWFWAALLVGLAAFRTAVHYGAGLLSLVIGQELLTIIRDRILVQVQALDLAYHWQHGVGEIVTRMTRDADKLRDALINFWRQMFETGLIVIASIALLCWYSPWLGIVPLGLMITGIAILAVQTDRLVELDRRTGAAYDRVTQDLSEGINGIRVIKAFHLGNARARRFDAQIASFAHETQAALRYAALRVPLPQAIIALGHVWVLGYGARLVIEGRLTVGALVAAVLLTNMLVLRVEGIGRLMQIIADARASAGRIWEFLDARPQLVSGALPLPRGPLGLRLDSVAVAAAGGSNETLRDVSLLVKPGEMVALVGPTGSGKSLLAALPAHLIEASRGSVRVGSDEDGWWDVRALNDSALRQRVHVLPQESFLFSDTLAANLRLGAPDASDADLLEALRIAAADDLIERLEDGLQTRVGDRGVTLSGGQRQRICLARALLSNADILILDDATSALDARTERTVIGNIRALRTNASRPVAMLVVSSRLSTVLMADRVLMLGEGRILAEGSHADLVRGNRGYRDLMGI